jgi:hypothetical protein
LPDPVLVGGTKLSKTDMTSFHRAYSLAALAQPVQKLVEDARTIMSKETLKNRE